MTQDISADYVIAGSGAVGMAFADVLLTESDATMIVIDRYAKPGGHWNVAYPFVQLHQPSSFYGVSSKELSGGRFEKGGLNDGLAELASGAEVSAYFDDVMRHQFLPSGRVHYFPMCDYHGDGRFVSKVTGETYRATAARKTVDATHLKTSVPATHTPNFEVAEGVKFIALNDLPKIETPPENYVVVGAGKTGIDACLWLLENRVDPDKITWIVSRDAWLLDRRNTQMSDGFFFNTLGAVAAQMESIAQAESIEDMFDRLEQSGYFLRIDPSVRPKMFHGATVSDLEIDQLRRIKHVVRLGHVQSISVDKIKLDQGVIATSPDTMHVDCSARAIANRELKTIFQGNLITPQLVRPYQPVFSAALIAHVELNYSNDEEKNRLCGLVPLPNDDTDFVLFTLAALQNQYQWNQDKPLQKWIAGNRLDGATKLVKDIKEGDDEKLKVVGRIRKNSPLAAAKLQQLKETI